MNFSFLHNRSILILRLSLGIVFLWVGILKLFNASPVQDIMAAAIPLFEQSELLVFGVSLMEIALGIAFVMNRFVKIAAIVMIIHLLIATGSVLFTQGFAPRFPILSLAGEFALKNLVLIAAGLVLISETTVSPTVHHSKEHERV